MDTGRGGKGYFCNQPAMGKRKSGFLKGNKDIPLSLGGISFLFLCVLAMNGPFPTSGFKVFCVIPTALYISLDSIYRKAFGRTQYGSSELRDITRVEFNSPLEQRVERGDLSSPSTQGGSRGSD